MSTAHADSSPPSPTAQERGLDHLAALITPDVEPAAFFYELIQTLLTIVSAEAIEVWLRTSPNEWMRLSRTRSASAPQPVSEPGLPAPEWVQESLTMSTWRTQPDELNGTRLTGPIRQGGEASGVLALQFPASRSTASLESGVPFLSAAGDLAGEFLALRELQTLRQDRAERHQVEQLQAQFASATQLEQLAGIIAHDGRAVCHADRLTVVQYTGSRARVLAVSGVDTIDPRSPVVQALESLARAVRETRSPLGLPSSSADAITLGAWKQLATIGGTKTAFLHPIRHVREGSLCALIAERFTDQPDDGWTARVSPLATAATPWWIALQAAQRPWWQGIVRRRRSARSVSTRIIIAGVLVALLIALALIPAPLTITAEGELTPVERRDLFATANGLVEHVLVKHADRVTVGQPVIQLRDPTVEMEATRVTGELATTRARLEVIEAARIASTTNTSETPARRQQLAGEAADLQQQCQALEAQQTLLESERTSWTLPSPINGQVLTWDVEALLSGRPIERGQVLLSVGNTAGDWEITARIRERDLRHLLGRENEAIGRRVEFLSALDPGQQHTGRVAAVARVTDLNERGESTVRVTISLDQPRIANLQTGTTIWPRIDCGHRSLGYVWFHDLIDAIRSGIWLRR